MSYVLVDRPRPHVAVVTPNRPELTERTLWASMDAASLEAHMHTEGLGQLLVRLLTDNFEEAVAARKDGRVPEFRDER